MSNKEKKSMGAEFKAMKTGAKILAVIIAILVYAYAIEVTQINLEEPQDPQRQAITTRVIRALAHPDILDYKEETYSVNIGILIPCDGEISDFEFTPDGRTVILSPNCADTTQDVITITGEGFRPKTEGIIRWHPPGDVVTTRALTSFRTDGDGNFTEEFSMPDIRPTDELQRIEIEEKWRTGINGLSETSIITIEKIIETVFMALMATTVGTLLAVPISFIAARNLMAHVGAPLASIMLGIAAIPVGGFIGWQITSWLLQLAEQTYGNVFVGIAIGIVSIIAAWAISFVGPPVFSDKKQSWTRGAISFLRLLLSSLLIFFAIAVFANQGVVLGEWLEDNLNQFAFLGNFIFLLSDGVRVLSAGIVGFLIALVAMSTGSKYGQELVLHLQGFPAKLFTGVTAGIGTAVFVYAIGSGLNWLYQFHEPQNWTIYPAIIGGVIMLIVGLTINPKKQFPIGLAMYTVTRSLFNVIRSIEPLIYVIVFAVWVGIGAFAGVIALTIHTIAALGKLFSEQVEGISEGPIEAITATGANRLQMIIFAVIPQIVPPYIAFTLYRWDINVRFSTIIGFAGGGGIGFVLVQNINLLKYRQASVMMIAIAVVVMSLDYISSKIRTRIK